MEQTNRSRSARSGAPCEFGRSPCASCPDVWACDGRACRTWQHWFAPTWNATIGRLWAAINRK